MSEMARPSFRWDELRCKCGCGTANINPGSLDRLQALRDRLGRPVYVTSAARCPRHNRRVGGAEESQHLSTPERPSRAFDIHVGDMTPGDLVTHAEAVGFTGIGLYDHFLHVDDRPKPARWDVRTWK